MPERTVIQWDKDEPVQGFVRAAQLSIAQLRHPDRAGARGGAGRQSLPSALGESRGGACRQVIGFDCATFAETPSPIAWYA